MEVFRQVGCPRSGWADRVEGCAHPADPPSWPRRVRARQTRAVLLKEIRAIAGEALVLSPQDRAAEDANTSWLGAPPHERMGMSAEEVVAAFEETTEALRDQVAASPHRGPVTFYVWHDQQAGQLRCSTGTCQQDGLPFGGPYRPTADLRSIVAEFLEDRAPGAIVWGALEPVPVPVSAETIRPEFAVWVCDLRP